MPLRKSWSIYIFKDVDFVAVTGERKDLPRKPNAAMVHYILDKMNLWLLMSVCLSEIPMSMSRRPSMPVARVSV
jgi:hypothetical protein